MYIGVLALACSGRGFRATRSVIILSACDDIGGIFEGMYTAMLDQLIS